MASNRFGFNVAVRIAGILFVGGLFLWTVLNTTNVATAVLLSFLIGVQTVLLIRFVSKSNRDLLRFLDALRHQDFSQRFSASSYLGSHGELRTGMEEIISRFQELHADKASQLSYLSTIIQQLPIAVLTFRENGEVVLANNAVRRLFRMPDLLFLNTSSGFDAEFLDAIHMLQPGIQTLVRVKHKNEQLQLNMVAMLLRSGDRTEKLLAMQNIHSQLEARELETWNNLNRVLAHEVMNSITPITSLAQTAREIMAEVQEEQDNSIVKSELLKSAYDAVDTIERRSEGLSQFVDSYRRLTHLPAPRMRNFVVQDLFNSIKKLLAADIKKRSVDFSSSITPSSLEITADFEMIEQALINLIANSLDAVEEVDKPSIQLAGVLGTDGKVEIIVTDNGCGIDPSQMQKIFVPFFTTKSHGSGIGMSLIRQIIQLHRGHLDVESTLGEGTKIALRF